MRECINEAVRCFEAVGSDLPALLRDAANTLVNLDRDYAWADLKVNTVFGDADYEGDYILSMDVHCT